MVEINLRSCLDFETDKGFEPISLSNLREMIDYFEYGTTRRIYLLILLCTGGRPSEPLLLNWNNNFSDNLIIYKTTKGSKISRICKIPPLIQNELEHYRDNNFFPRGQIFSFQYKAFQRYFNDHVRDKLSQDFQKLCPFSYDGSVKQRHKITLRSLRVTIATLIYYYFKKVYGDSVALSRTCMWMGHESRNMTADHYIKHIHKLGIEDYPDLPLLQLLDHIVYHEHQIRLDCYVRQSKMAEF